MFFAILALSLAAQSPKTDAPKADSPTVKPVEPDDDAPKTATPKTADPKAAKPKAKTKKAQAMGQLVPDFQNLVKEGERAVLVEDGDPLEISRGFYRSILVALDKDSFNAMVRSKTSVDLYNDLTSQKRIAQVPSQTFVVVKKIIPHTQFGTGVGDAVEATITAGPFRGKTIWVRRHEAIRLVEIQAAKKRR